MTSKLYAGILIILVATFIIQPAFGLVGSTLRYSSNASENISMTQTSYGDVVVSFNANHGMGMPVLACDEFPDHKFVSWLHFVEGGEGNSGHVYEIFHPSSGFVVETNEIRVLVYPYDVAKAQSTLLTSGTGIHFDTRVGVVSSDVQVFVYMYFLNTSGTISIKRVAHNANGSTVAQQTDTFSPGIGYWSQRYTGDAVGDFVSPSDYSYMEFQINGSANVRVSYSVQYLPIEASPYAKTMVIYDNNVSSSTPLFEGSPGSHAVSNVRRNSQPTTTADGYLGQAPGVALDYAGTTALQKYFTSTTLDSTGRYIGSFDTSGTSGGTFAVDTPGTYQGFTSMFQFDPTTPSYAANQMMIPRYLVENLEHVTCRGWHEVAGLTTIASEPKRLILASPTVPENNTPQYVDSGITLRELKTGSTFISTPGESIDTSGLNFTATNASTILDIMYPSTFERTDSTLSVAYTTPLMTRLQCAFVSDVSLQEIPAVRSGFSYTMDVTESDVISGRCFGVIEGETYEDKVKSLAFTPAFLTVISDTFEDNRLGLGAIPDIGGMPVILIMAVMLSTCGFQRYHLPSASVLFMLTIGILWYLDIVDIPDVVFGAILVVGIFLIFNRGLSS